MAYITLIDPTLGELRISRRHTSRASARWVKGRAHIIVPYGMPPSEIQRLTEQFRPFLERTKKRGLFSAGGSLAIEGGPVIRFERSAHLSGCVKAFRSGDGIIISIAEDFDLEDPQADGVISRLLISVAHILAPEILLPIARAEADRLGLRPKELSVSRGYRVLGHCSPDGRIAISSACIFLTADLRRYIICHELAHLSEMNHSARFHALCNQYLSGQEAILADKLKTYPWPIAR